MRVASALVPASAFCATCAFLLACGGSTSDDFVGPTGKGGHPHDSGTSGSGGSQGGTSGSSGSGGTAVFFDAAPTGDSSLIDGMQNIQTPVRKIPGLVSMTFYERTGGTAPTPYTFVVDGPELSARLPDPLSQESHDIPGADTEYYDVYYSDGEGTFNLDGSYLTISGVFQHALPKGGGLNLAEIGLNYSGNKTEYGNYVASYVALGDNKSEASIDACIDGDLQTHTTMGNTIGSSDRLRLTLGFLSSSGPAPPK